MDRFRAGLATNGDQVADVHSDAQAGEAEQCKRLRAAFLNRLGERSIWLSGDLYPDRN